MSLKTSQKKFLNDAIIREISDQVVSLKYGTILIEAHDAKIIQVEVTARTRYEDMWIVKKGGGI